VLTNGLIEEIDRRAVRIRVALVLGQFITTLLAVLYVPLYLSLPWSALAIGGVAAIFGVALIFAPPIRRTKVDEDRLYREFNERFYRDVRTYGGG